MVCPANGISFGNKKEWNPRTYIMDEPWKCCATWNKPITKDHMLYFIPFMWNITEQAHLERDRINQWLPRVVNEVGEEIGVTANGFRVSFWGDKNVLKWFWWCLLHDSENTKKPFDCNA